MKSFVLIAVVLGLFGCDKPGTPTQGTSAVTFTREGGVASQPLTLTIDAKGHAQLDAVTGTKKSHRTFTLTSAQRRSLRTALDAARNAPKPETIGGCADCFIYTIKADGLSVKYDESAQAPAAIEHLAQVLSSLG